MGTERLCIFYRTSSKHPGVGLGVGHCDLGMTRTVCDGDIRFCEKPEALIEYLYVEWTRCGKGEMGYEVRSEAKS